MLAVDDRHIDDFIEEDFDDERVDDCQDAPPLDVTSQDPEVGVVIRVATLSCHCCYAS